jgi:hypothetical protein
MIRILTRVTAPQRAPAWVQVVRDTSATQTGAAAPGAYQLQFGTGGEESTPDGSVPLSEFDRSELVKALGGMWVKG